MRLWRRGGLICEITRVVNLTTCFKIIVLDTMTSIYPYTYMSQGEGVWWGIRCSERVYERMVRQMHETPRCFVHLTNVRGENIVVAVEGPHSEGDNIFAPDWVFQRLGIEFGDQVTLDAILEPMPKGATVVLRPMTGVTVEGPMFLEGLTEALNQLGVVQEGRLLAIVDPSTAVLHEFMVEDLTPARVCLADGELTVDLQRAVDRPPTPEPVAPPDFDDGPVVPVQPTHASRMPFVPFGGKGYRLDGK